MIKLLIFIFLKIIVILIFIISFYWPKFDIIFSSFKQDNPLKPKNNITIKLIWLLYEFL